VGKTTLIRHLQAMGERVVEETARAVIRQQVETGGQGVPWLDNDLYVSLCVTRDTAIFDAMADESGRVFFDRGIIDSHGANGTIPSPEVVEAVRTRRYNACVFIFPPWREIYETDAERRQDWQEAERTFEIIRQHLPTLGYEPVVVPKGSVADRAAFVLERAVLTSS
jgi:predicted ATPase